MKMRTKALVGGIVALSLQMACSSDDSGGGNPNGATANGDGDGDGDGDGNEPGDGDGDDDSSGGDGDGDGERDAATSAPPMPEAGVEEPSRFALGSVVIDVDGNRTTYIQVIDSLDEGPFDNTNAVEIPGNGVVLAHGNSFYAGLVESPTWVKYTVSESGDIEEGESLSFLAYGASSIDYGNAIVDADRAVSVLGAQGLAIVWNPTTMEIEGEIELGDLAREGYDAEVWTTVAHDGLVYVPTRWSDWEGGRIYPAVQTVILDPVAMQVVGVAEDDRCASAGRIVFDEDGYGYVMGDGRTYSSHMFENAGGDQALDNCLLRIAPGETDFEQDYFYTIPSLTGGLESITELEAGDPNGGIGFAKMFYPDELPEGVEPVDFAFWDEPAHKMWRILLADPPTAEEVEGAPFSTIGFTGSPFRGKLYAGESPDGNTSAVYEFEPKANTATPRFEMDGYFYGLFELSQ